MPSTLTPVPFEAAVIRFLRRAPAGTPVPDPERSYFEQGAWIFRAADGRVLGSSAPCAGR